VCGRFTLSSPDLAALAAAWAAEVDAATRAAWRPRYNVAPGDRHVLLRRSGDGRRIEPAAFGLEGPGGRVLLNARVETAAARPAFREAWTARRCAVPADGFFEWEGPATARRPTWFHLPDRRPLLLGALYAHRPDGSLAFAILTTEAVAPVRALHDRMPVVVPEPLLGAWLEGRPPPLPAPAPGLFAARRVSATVNSVTHDDPACIEPDGPPPQLRLF
jgi:putative SOS response-associated peptidase YedK